MGHCAIALVMMAALFGSLWLAVAGELSTGLTLVPLGPVTDKIEVEARVGLVNATDEEQAVRVTVSVDGEPLLSDTVTVSPSGSALVSAWWPTAGQVGDHRVSYRVEQRGVEVAQGGLPLRVEASDTRALPVFQAGWIDFLGLLNSVYPRNRDVTGDDLRHLIDSMHDLGMETAIVTYVEFQGRFFYPTDLRFYDRDMKKEAAGNWLPYDAVETILSQADRHGMHVFLGLGRGGDMGLMADGIKDPQRLQASIANSRASAADLWERYGHHASLYGWYLTHEMHDLALASAYYDPVADFCHSFAPDRPVLVAPDGTPLTSPETLAASHVDIFAYQDAVGPGYVPYEYTYDPEGRIASLDEVFSDYQRRHAGTRKHLWADLELWEMTGPEYGSPYPPPWSRVARQLATECRYVEMVTAYELTGFMEMPGSDLLLNDRRAEALYRGYEAYLRDVTGD